MTGAAMPHGLLRSGESDAGMQVGTGSFFVQAPASGARTALEVFYHHPRGFLPRDPVVMLLHGSDRAGSYFRDCWIKHAEALQVLVVAPCFDEQNFPGPGSYNYGNVLAARNPFKARPPSEWSYGLLDRVFLHVQESMRLERPQYYVFGHSAGAQFAHRCLALLNSSRIELAVLANSGWYTLPSHDLLYPDGLGGLQVGASYVDDYLRRSIVILLGELDNDPNDPGLPREPAAMAQGDTRVARGEFYFRRCKELAGQLGVAFGWKLSYAPGVAHEDAEVAVPAADLIKAYLADHR